MAREGCEAGLAVHGGEDVECELLWPLYDDMVACWVPSDHVMVFGLFKQTE